MSLRGVQRGRVGCRAPGGLQRLLVHSGRREEAGGQVQGGTGAGEGERAGEAAAGRARAAGQRQEAGQERYRCRGPSCPRGGVGTGRRRALQSAGELGVPWPGHRAPAPAPGPITSLCSAPWVTCGLEGRGLPDQTGKLRLSTCAGGGVPPGWSPLWRAITEPSGRRRLGEGRRAGRAGGERFFPPCAHREVRLGALGGPFAAQQQQLLRVGEQHFQRLQLRQQRLRVTWPRRMEARASPRPPEPGALCLDKPSAPEYAGLSQCYGPFWPRAPRWPSLLGGHQACREGASSRGSPGADAWLRVSVTACARAPLAGSEGTRTPPADGTACLEADRAGAAMGPGQVCGW